MAAPAPVRRHLATPSWTIEARAEQGLVRKTMQDTVGVLANAPCAWLRCDAVAVFDGVGGFPFGAEAALAAAGGLQEAMRGARSAEDIFTRLHGAVRDTQGATTGVLVLLPREGDQAELVWSGDSNAYGLDEHGGIVPISEPDSEAGYLTQCLGLDGMKPHAKRVAVRSGQAVLICSDGVDGVVGRLPLQKLLQGPASQDGAHLDQIMAEVAKAGAPDNATIVLARRRA